MVHSERMDNRFDRYDGGEEGRERAEKGRVECGWQVWRRLPQQIIDWYGPLERDEMRAVEAREDGSVRLHFASGTTHRWVFGGEPGHGRWWLVGE